MSSNMRPAQDYDQTAIRRVVKDAGVSPLNIHWSRFIVVEVRGDIVGIGQIKDHGDGSRELASIAVMKKFRGLGIASQIIRKLIALEKERQNGLLYLMCLSPMHDFYTRFGFRLVEDTAVPRDMRRLQRLGNLFASIGGIVSSRPRSVLVMALDLSQVDPDALHGTYHR